MLTAEMDGVDTAHVFSSTQRGCTALMYAALRGHADCVRLLIGYQADLDAIDRVRELSKKLHCYLSEFSLIVNSP